MLLHNTQELEDNLGARADQDLSLTLTLGVDDGVESIVLKNCKGILSAIYPIMIFPYQSQIFILTRTETRTIFVDYYLVIKEGDRFLLDGCRSYDQSSVPTSYR
jgi:hypothetical protein